jgi:hypothetical protein
MARHIIVTRTNIILVGDGRKFYVGSKYFDALIRAIETAKTMPIGSIIKLKIDEENEYEEEIEEEEEELEEEWMEEEEEEFT